MQGNEVQGQATRDPEIIMIVGTGRSGSTALEQAICQRLDAYPLGEIFSLPGLFFAGKETCSCGTPFDRCDFWRSIFDDHAPQLKTLKGLRRDIRLRKAFAIDAERSAAYRSIYESIFRRVAEKTGHPSLLDSSKNPVHCACLAESGYVTKIIHLQRAAADSIGSWSKDVDDPQRGRVLGKISPFRAASKWVLENYISYVLLSGNAKYVFLRYEELTEEGLAVLIGGQSAPRQGLEHAETTFHTVSGNPSRNRTGALVLQKPKLKLRFRLLGLASEAALAALLALTPRRLFRSRVP